MDIDPNSKRIDWLDDERRKDNNRIGALEQRLIALEGNFLPLPNRVKDLESEITRLAALLTRMDHFDETLMQQRIETKQYFEELERQNKKREEETEKVRRVELRSLETSLVELRKELETLPELKRNLKARVDEESRLAKLIDEVRARIDTVKRSEEEYTRTFRLLDDGRRQDAKRLTDLTGEAAALRKRVDENRGRIELNAQNFKKIETRMNDLSVIETERREAQDAFMERQALYQVERERVWKEWEARFQVMEAQTAEIESNLQTLDTTHRIVKRSQQVVEELTVKVDRRINELTEIQRLAEERFRQEWVTFRADDQKRWTNYTLTLEEQRNETGRQFEKLNEKVAQLEETAQSIQDLVNQVNEQTEKRMQSLLAVAHEWVTNYERTIGRIPR